MSHILRLRSGRGLFVICLVLLALTASAMIADSYEPRRASAAPNAALTITVDKTTDPNGFPAMACTDAADDCSLRHAIRKANGDPANSYTIIVPAGTYTLTLVSTNEDANLNGDLDISRTMTITGAGASSTIINGNGATTGDGVFHIISGTIGTVNISGVTVKNGVTAGIRNFGTLLNLSNCVVTNNEHSGVGGGISNSNAPMTIDNCTISNNTADGAGGGIGNFASLAWMTITNSTISDNIATTEGDGGGIYNLGNMTIMNSTISGNYLGTGTAEGGGIFNHSLGRLTLIDSTVRQNDALFGGGIQTDGALTITRSAIISNTASTAAGLRTSGVLTLSIVNSTFSGNLALGTGGGMSLNSGATVNLSNVTVAYNEADSDNNITGAGGGINLASGVTVTLKNSIVAWNTANSGTGPNCSGTLYSVNYTDISGTSGCTVPAGTGNKTLLPALIALANNGGPTLTHALGSTDVVALNAGNPGGCTDHNSVLLTTDQRGFLRHVGRCDMGAFELNYPIYLPLVIR